MLMFSHKLKQAIKKVLTVTGLHSIPWKYIPNGVYVFNYHRIGERNSCQFDREVFSCSTRAFEEQCLFIKNNFQVISLEELETIINNNKQHENRYAVFTFDDGYIDNFTEAFPVLKKHGISASFYVATDFVGSELIPWWDEIAYILRLSCGSSYQLPSKATVYNLELNNLEAVISRIIYDAKRLKSVTVLEVLDDIRAKFPEEARSISNVNQQLFMDWEQLCEMTSAGMNIGSHTLSHQMLSQLSLELQERELKVSKEIIEKNIPALVSSVVYPVGRKHCYTSDTCRLAALLGYKFGFNNEPGRITSKSNSHDLNRYCIGSDDIVELKLSILFNL